MTLAIQPERLYSEQEQRIRTTIRALLLIVALVTIDGLNHHSRIIQYQQQLPIELYEFASKYESALLGWHASNSGGEGKVDGPVLIQFEKVYRPQQSLTPGYTSVDSIPFLDAYLNQNLPGIAIKDTSFLGYKMDFSLYLAIVLIAPGLLLLLVVLRVWQLRRTWQLIPSRTSRLVTDILALRLFRATQLGMVYLVVGIMSFFLLLVALLPPFLAAFQIRIVPEIKGTMSLNPVGIPLLENEHTALRLPVPDEFMVMVLLASTISLIASICIAVMLIKRSAHSNATV